MALERFGPFARVFAQGELKVPGHLELLGLGRPSAQVVIDRIERALSLDQAARFVDVLFAEPNWRPHLVGAIALIIDDGQTLDPSTLWHAIDAGSWVIPQLVVTALFVDGSFPEKLMTRIQNKCAVSVPPGLSPVERHSATGPANTIQRSAKLLGSLLSAGKAVPSLSAWLDGVQADPGIIELLNQDIDHAPRIADSWRQTLVAQFARRGRALKPKAREAPT